MCYSTKRKIAECVKELVRYKEIRKITIHDIMEKTNMSRQSFYYNFKDIYDVLAWIGIHDIAARPDTGSSCDINDWLEHMMKTINSDPRYYNRVINELSWPLILDCMRQPMVATLNSILEEHGAECIDCDSQFFVNLLCYYLMDYIHNNRAVSTKDVVTILNYMQQIKPIPAYVATEQNSLSTMLCSC